MELASEEIKLQNKIRSLRAQYLSYEKQVVMINTLVDNYTTMLYAEERKLQLGESSIFLVNTREKSLIASKIKQISIQQKLWDTGAELKRVLVAFKE